MDWGALNVCGVYYGLCTATGKWYVGSGYNARGRVKNHIKLLSRGLHYNPHLQNSWNKYGDGAFEWGLIESCSRENLHEREQHWVTYHRSFEPDHGFNITFPVQQRVPSERKSKIHRELWQDPEVRARYVDASRAYWASDEARDMVEHGIASMSKLETREAVAESLRKYYKDNPHIAEEISQRFKNFFAVEENRKAASEHSKSIWQNTEIRAQIMASIHEANKREDVKERRRNAARKRGQNPEYRAKVSASRKAQFQDESEHREKHLRAAQNPERNKLISDKAKARWADPEYRKRVGALISAAKQAKKVLRNKG